MPGTLFVVATPIGNLEDLTFRALRTLREVDLVAAEDTRRTAHLLARYEVRKPLTSLREHNEVKQAPRLLARMQAGSSIALLSDAGTPGISDPGARLVRAARDAGVPVVPIPGPSAVTAALSASGVPADQFVFLGFPPSSGKARQDWLAQVAAESRTQVFFESPHRIERTISDILKVKQPIYVHRELTKIHEELVICTNIDKPNLPEGKGEFTVVIPAGSVEQSTIDERAIYELFTRLQSGVAVGRDEAIHLVALAHGATDQVVRKIIKKITISVKQQNAPPA
jgi:16S rRNA (cytidine1402-2'-O)-methyltransferase